MTFQTSDYLTLLGPALIQTDATGDHEWSNLVGYSAVLPTDIVNGAVWKPISIPHPAGTSDVGMEAVPAAYSIRVNNPASFANASGLFHIGRLKGPFNAPLATDTRTTADVAAGIVSYANPCTIGGAAIARKGLQVNAVPSNMSEVSHFAHVNDNGLAAGLGGAATWTPNDDEFSAFNPMYIVNVDGKEIAITVCVEWRLRASIFNPMHGAGTQHSPTDSKLWNAVTSAASTAGHGVQDLAETGGFGAAAYAADSAAGTGIFDAISGMASSAGAALTGGLGMDAGAAGVLESMLPLLAL